MSLSFDSEPELTPSGYMVEIVRELTIEDLQAVSGAPLGWKRSPLQKITIAHHTIARMTAEGTPVMEISAVTGRTPASITQLRADPAFKELVVHYKKVNEIAKVDLEQQLTDVSSTALNTLQERMETEPEKMSDQDLRKIAQLGLDRTGFGPSKTVKINNAAEVIKELVKERKSREGGRIIDVTPVSRSV